MADHNPQHGRRPHFHRGRRGTDRRGGDRRTPQREHPAEHGAREAPRDGGSVDVEQIMRDIRARIAQRHGIELSTQQIQELAARRLDAILEPRNIKPQLLEQLRKAAGSTPDLPSAPAIETYEFEETTLYETHRGVLRFVRRLLNPILKLLFNPTPLISALQVQARLNKELSARDADRERRQAEWNALHYELVQRVVLETSRLAVEMQALSSRIESLGAKVDFNERRVRGLETPASPPQGRQQPRQPEAPPPSAPAREVILEAAATVEGGAEAGRRRRRRRRGRRPGGGIESPAGAVGTGVSSDDEDIVEGVEADEEDVNGAENDSGEPVMAVAPAAEAAPAPQLASQTPPPVESSPLAPPSPPRDEPFPAAPVDHADSGPVDK